MTLLASATSDWVTAAIAILAAGIALYQLWQINKQSRLAANASKSQSYGQVTQQMSLLTEVFFQHPDWLAYFYEGDDPEHEHGSPLPADLRRRLELVCEAIADFADGLVEQRRTVPEADMDWSTWDAYMRFMHQSSPFLRRYLRDNTDFYPDYLLSVFGYLVVRDELSGEIASEWAVTEWRRPEDEQGEGPAPPAAWMDETFRPPGRAGGVGYPWMRTWLITRYVDDGAGAEPPLLAALVHPSTPEAAHVELAWHTPPDEDDRAAVEAVLCSWVVEQLESSSRLRSARVHFLEEGEWRDRGRVLLASATRTRRIPRPVTAALRRRAILRKAPTDPGRERYLARKFELRGPRRIR